MKIAEWKPKRPKSLLEKILIIAGILGGIAAIMAIGYFVYDRFFLTPPEEMIEKMEVLEKKVDGLAEYLDGLPQTKNPQLKRLFEKGYALYEDEEYPEAIDTFRACLELKTKDGERLGLLILIGNAYFTLGKLKEAEDHYEEALLIGERIHDQEGKGKALGNIGLIYQVKGDLDRALKYHQGAFKIHNEAFKIHHEIGFRKGEATALGNIGLIYQAKGDWDQAFKCHQAVLKIYKQIGHRRGEATALGNIGLIYQAKDSFDLALEYLKNALKIDTALGFKEGEAIDLNNIGGIYLKKGDLDNALIYIKKALKIFKEIGMPREIELVTENIEIISRKKEKMKNK